MGGSKMYSAGGVGDSRGTRQSHCICDLHILKCQVSRSIAIPSALVLQQLLDGNVVQAAIPQYAIVWCDIDSPLPLMLNTLALRSSRPSFAN